ncbi:Glucose/arabinose dehydrogenase, beta-propeller fold [Kaistia soli DSM 19436]|uniref:Glucose/arabinose dehydrogenase, beta-propeller fold n=1 Tax=Kaistia soli DSM 19436 TaxID=1122133 RepID=A0A1M5DG82_9HYPH|nr:PQQ-dependent sugar dehydrogenase [Kaistia soli]SHF65891.1 Glucose/arabinose dehydrogenase, beta-propeller fold [Kaistia soli DSM 19436]
MKPIATAALLLLLTTSAHAASVNAGDHKPSTTKPFAATEVASFDTPWALAFLPDGRMLVTEKPGHLFLVTEGGQKMPIGNVPAVAAKGQNGLLDIAPSPNFTRDQIVYLTYVAPEGSGGTLMLARAKLSLEEVDGRGRLDDLVVIWRQTPEGGGGQPGGIIAFDPAGTHLFLTVGDRMRPESAQNPDEARGKVLRVTLDGKAAPDNPDAAAGGVRGETWSTGHRNPYGLAFAPDGALWLNEMGPRGGDELNLIEPGRNYGWPIVSNGDNYNGTAIPRHATRPEFAAPALYWNPVIAPAGLVFYEGSMFPQWRGSAFIGGLAVDALVRVTFDGKGNANETERWEMGARIRDVAVAPDGALWLIEDDDPGRLLRLVPAKPPS